MRNVRAQRHAVALCALALGMSGCLMVGFDPLDDEPQALSPEGGQGGSSGGSSGAAGQAGQSNTGGQGGSAGATGIRPDAGAGSGGTMVTPTLDAAVPIDAGPPVITSCTGHDNFDGCEDGLYCTVRDYCFSEVCIDGTARVCGDDCNVGTCNEANDACDLVPLPNDTECGPFGAFICINGRCSSPLVMCTDGGDCTPSCTNSACNVSCPNANSCQPTCTNGSECAIDCQGANTCTVVCEDSTCATMCQGSGTCDVDCKGDTTACAILCTDASGCDQSDCLDGAHCTLQCNEAESCGFRTCWAGEQQCGNGKVVCDADCNG